MACYFCIVSTRREAVADLVVLDARDDAEAVSRAYEVVGTMGEVERVLVHHGERQVGVLEGSRQCGPRRAA